MVIGVLQFELLIPWAESLKDKRRVVSSVKDRLHRQHLVSVAEVGAHDILNVAVMGVAVVTGDGRRAGDVLDRIEAKLRGSMTDAELGDTHREILTGRSGSFGPNAEADAQDAGTEAKPKKGAPPGRGRSLADELRSIITEEDVERLAAELDADGRLDA